MPLACRWAVDERFSLEGAVLAGLLGKDREHRVGGEVVWRRGAISGGVVVGLVYDFGRYLGRRYAKSRIIWVLGGDVSGDNGDGIAMWRNLAAGITRGVANARGAPYRVVGEMMKDVAGPLAGMGLPGMKF